jgi:DNA-directed RNA polymerase subunit RPC12/RpoP
VASQEPETGVPAAAGEASHRCPRCGARHAERRTPRTLLERAGLTLLGRRPYRCLDCGRRFGDRPLARDPGANATALDATVTAAAVETKRRHTHWVVDPGDVPLSPAQVYVLVLAAGVVIAVLVFAVRALWPETGGGIRVVD